jgi:hypothetical protein
LENSQMALTGLLCSLKSACTPYASVEHVIPLICGWPCTHAHQALSLPWHPVTSGNLQSRILLCQRLEIAA